MSHPFGKTWTRAEDDTIRELAPEQEASDVAVALGRSVSAVFHRMARLGIQKRRRWTKADEAALEAMWGHALPTIARALKRTVITVYWRAQRLGLGLGCPDGYEYLSAAALRCGYCASQLRRILRWAGVAVRKSVTRYQSRRTFHWVDPFEVDEAVRRWHETETLNAAARRHSLHSTSLEVRLRMVGAPLPPKPGKKLHWRIPSATVDLAVATTERRGRVVSLVEQLGEVA